MKQFLYAVYDSAAEAFNAPISVISKGAAVRSFSDAVADPKTDFSKHPESYTLFAIGEWYPLSGEIITFKAPERVISALECVSVEQRVDAGLRSVG